MKQLARTYFVVWVMRELAGKRGVVLLGERRFLVLYVIDGGAVAPGGRGGVTEAPLSHGSYRKQKNQIDEAKYLHGAKKATLPRR